MRGKRGSHRRWVAVLGLVTFLVTSPLGAGGAFPVPMMPAPLAQAKSLSEQLREKMAELERLRSRMRQNETGLQRTRAQERSTANELNRLERELGATAQQLAQIEDKLAEAEARLAETARRLEAEEAELARRTELLERRVRAIYEQGTVGYLEVLLASASFADFLTRFDLLQQVVEGDVELFEEVTARRNEVARLKLEQEGQRAEIAALRAQVAEKKERLAVQAASKEQALTRIQQDAAAYERALDELERTSKEVEKLIRSLESQIRRTGAIVMEWPVQGRISSNFGMRYHPILKKNRGHTGTDFAVPSGTPIKAAESGQVILADWFGGYGLAILIDHGNGVSTLYAHTSKVAVKQGQMVQRGQVIGYVGSTGLSTGPHLHFEVREKGVPVNPMGPKYLGR